MFWIAKESVRVRKYKLQTTEYGRNKRGNRKKQKSIRKVTIKLNLENKYNHHGKKFSEEQN